MDTIKKKKKKFKYRVEVHSPKIKDGFFLHLEKAQGPPGKSYPEWSTSKHNEGENIKPFIRENWSGLRKAEEPLYKMPTGTQAEGFVPKMWVK